MIHVTLRRLNQNLQNSTPNNTVMTIKSNYDLHVTVSQGLDSPPIYIAYYFLINIFFLYVMSKG
jgi:hypothetical protein